MMQVRKNLLGVIACLWWLTSAPCSGLHGAEVLPGTQVAAYQAVHVVPGERERVFVVPVGDPQPRTFEVVAAASGHQLLFGEPGQYLVLWFKEGAADQGQVSVTIRQPGPVPPGPNPPQPVPPGPTPPGPVPPAPDNPVAVRLLPLVKAAADPASAAKLAATYRTVLEDLRAERIRSVLVARTKVVNSNNGLVLAAAWRPAIEAMDKELESAVTVAALDKVLAGIVSALEAVR